VAGSRRDPAVGQDEPLVAAEPGVAVHVDEYECSDSNDAPECGTRDASVTGAGRRLLCVGRARLALGFL
jgi:hypothetical protein